MTNEEGIIVFLPCWSRFGRWMGARVAQKTTIQYFVPGGHGPGLRYGVAVCIQSGSIVWINGPFPCGTFADIVIFRQGLIYMLDRTRCVPEMGEADNGYNGEGMSVRIMDERNVSVTQFIG